MEMSDQESEENITNTAREHPQPKNGTNQTPGNNPAAGSNSTSAHFSTIPQDRMNLGAPPAPNPFPYPPILFLPV